MTLDMTLCHETSGKSTVKVGQLGKQKDDFVMYL